MSDSGLVFDTATSRTPAGKVDFILFRFSDMLIAFVFNRRFVQSVNHLIGRHNMTSLHMPFALCLKTYNLSLPRLSLAGHKPLVRVEFAQSHRAAGVKFLR